MSNQGIIFNIQRFTLHDGPGLRTELFLKGCPMRCDWCGNPESWSTQIELGVYKKKCISKKKCGLCLFSDSNEDALTFYRGKLAAIDSKKCSDCSAYASACPADAIKQWGEAMTVESCMEIIRKDKEYYEQSGGGVIVSGGEALLQSDFVAELFAECKKEGIQTCFETTFYSNWQKVEILLPYTDIWISDIKHMDSKIHRKRTGVGNEVILKNLKKMSELDRELILRIPVIPDFNDDMKNIEATADFILNDLNGQIRTLQLLSFMRLGVEKYEALGIPYAMEGVKVHRKSFQKQVEKIADYMNSRGIHCLVGTKEKQ
ncbi:(2S)-3-sulfopropanediol dehydratase activating enzyme [Enterococcus raffinosus]|uniref:Glycyl-radical enzyme activating protein n=1 Tax=Enterococcus raffinosus TaxID=71452 RepID=A0AAW8TAN2_9ENTE|nr:glycyl-radical enzyme activating protein [Enterococcus raffinosus]MDT2524151.1 glycyl-radical enzyme activating protein [Enterococcus raffinosus]MDT2534868.1 glycyl-radical enzyme activating protein [Enterococcus raffinosus]MDT2545364.1 glycyl-radical enzyme activating protein [Enterococcus raffinosus]MDT2553942.1 glycyl-radical enzyme activating protein [Enterococcus raffinosus]MDT2579253.1 glycyl-radical enzyme activating protein [Enterococcus raffinosus]